MQLSVITVPWGRHGTPLTSLMAADTPAFGPIAGSGSVKLK